MSSSSTRARAPLHGDQGSAPGIDMNRTRSRWGREGIGGEAHQEFLGVVVEEGDGPKAANFVEGEFRPGWKKVSAAAIPAAPALGLQQRRRGRRGASISGSRRTWQSPRRQRGGASSHGHGGS